MCHAARIGPMPQPLPVDVVSTWWDYFVDGVAVVSGLATALAFIYAAQTYHRQIEDRRRDQASKVLIDLESRLKKNVPYWVCIVQNLSELPILWPGIVIGSLDRVA